MDINTTIKTEKSTDNDLNSTVGISRCDDFEGKSKNHRRKKLRRLVDAGDLTKSNHNSTNKCKRILIVTTLLTCSIAVLMGHYFIQNNSNTKQILREFIKNYRNQYIQIVHGKHNYCDQKQPLDTATIFAQINQTQILHQDQALQQIELALRNESDLNGMALIGPVGVGKSLFMRAFEEKFPWQENVHSYAWNTYVKNETDKFHLIRVLIENLSECGKNLLVIENLQACDHGVVEIINKLLKEANKKQHKHVVLFYVFNLNTMLSPEVYEQQRDLLQSSLSDCKVINFNRFTQLELKDCIQREADLENVQLTAQDFDEIVATINPLKSGCKNVNAKVLMYGTIKTKDIK